MSGQSMDATHWQRIRRQRLELDDYLCQFQLADCSVVAVDVRLSAEMDEDDPGATVHDCTSICASCKAVLEARDEPPVDAGPPPAPDQDRPAPAPRPRSWPRVRGFRRSGFFANVVARVGALVALAVATLIVARAEGPSGVGAYALLRVLPGLMGVVISSGLPGAVAYFLAGPSRQDRRLPFTLLGMAVVGGVAGTLLWDAGSLVAGHRLFPDLTHRLLLLAGVTVLTQLVVATVKSCSQGSGDLRGANIVIFNEEFMFLPAYGVLHGVGLTGFGPLVTALLLADVATFVLALDRLYRRGFFRHAAPPSRRLARAVAGYGLRAQVGGVVTLLNLRFDFLVLQIIAGPAVLGFYAIASKFAELVKVPALALTYVLYPQYARQGREVATARARQVLPRAGLLIGLAVIPFWVAATLLIPVIYGSEFRPAITPAHIILVGLVLEGVAGVITGFLYGIGRPGLNSLAMGAGLVVTFALDLALIPKYGANGAAVASAAAYLTSTFALMILFTRLSRPPRADETDVEEPPPSLFPQRSSEELAEILLDRWRRAQAVATAVADPVEPEPVEEPATEAVPVKRRRKRKSAARGAR